MRHEHQIELERLGLSAVEAKIYLALLEKSGRWGASAVAATMRIPRSTVYVALNSLLDLGLLQAEAGYGGRFSAVPAEQALPSLVVREREELLQRQRDLSERETVAQQLASKLQPRGEQLETDSETEFIQVIRDPRVISDRFDRLRMDAKRQIEIFVKAPIVTPGEDLLKQEILRRGVRLRCLYERATLDRSPVKEHLAKWISQGEEARRYDGQLPHKLAIFDEQDILMPFITPGSNGKTLVIRNQRLAMSLGMLFEFLWERSEPLTLEKHTKLSPAAKRPRSKAKQHAPVPLTESRNGQQS